MKNTIKLPLLIGLTFSGFLSLTSALSATPIDLKHTPKLMLKMENGSSFKTISKVTDFKHNLHTRLQQMYRGYPVWGADIIQHSGSRNFLSGLMYQGLSADLPEIPQSNAVLSNQQETTVQQAKKYYQYQNKSNNFSILKTQTYRLVYIDKNNKAHWAYYVEMLTRNNDRLEQPVYILDADSHQIYQSWNNFHTIDDELKKVSGGGFGGNSKIGIKVYDGAAPINSSFKILRNIKTNQCYLQGSIAESGFLNDFFTVNDGSHMFDSEPQIIPTQYECRVGSPEHRGIYWNKDQAFAADNDAFYHANVTNNMYLQWFNRPVVLNPGATDESGDADQLPIQIYTHLRMANAAWYGPIKGILFGDGDDAEYASFTSLDIVAHELSHGFTEQNANLIYNGQSGGLNESFSDMGAVATSYFVSGQSQWKIGSDITLIADALRYMDNPRHDCVGKQPYATVGGYKIRQCSIDHMKDYKDGDVEIFGTMMPYVDVHYSSGIFNKAFYLIAQGWGGDKNEGTRKAFNVMVQANRGYWTPNTTFQDAACGVLEATHDYGYDEAVVSKAFQEVGLDISKC